MRACVNCNFFVSAATAQALALLDIFSFPCIFVQVRTVASKRNSVHTILADALYILLITAGLLSVLTVDQSTSILLWLTVSTEIYMTNDIKCSQLLTFQKSLISYRPGKVLLFYPTIFMWHFLN